MNDPDGHRNATDIEEMVIQLARQGIRAGELIEQVSQILQRPVGQVRRFVQNRYPGLMTKAKAEPRVAPERPDRPHAHRDKIRGKASDVYGLPARKRQGGYRF